jgi:diguanylate cyclase (GGDEF)-like protein
MKLHRFSRASVFVLLLAAVFVAAVIAIAVTLNRESRAFTLSESETQAVRFVSGAESAINRSLLGVEVLLASLDKLLDLSGKIREWVDPVKSSEIIQNFMHQSLLVSRVALVDEQGKTLASSNVNDPTLDLNLPQSFLDDVLNQPISTLVINTPMENFISSEVVLYMGRHIRLADGSKLIAVAEVPVSRIATILTQGADIAGLQTTIELKSGQLLVAAPLVEKNPDTLSPPLDSLSSWDHPKTTAARLSGEQAIVAVRGTLYSGVFVTASIPLASALHSWQRDVLYVKAVAAALILMIVAAAGASVLYLNRMVTAQASIAVGKKALDQALESMVSGFVLIDANRRVQYWNRRFVELHPWLEDLIKPQVEFVTLVERTCLHLLPHEDEAHRQQWVIDHMDELSQLHEARQIVTIDGIALEITERPTPDGGVVILYQDVTRLRRAVADVELLAFYDPLTGLPNRRLLSDRLQQGINAGLRTGRHGALLFLDLDHFKTLNDTAGHEMGDLMLQQVAQRLKSCVREEDTVARLGGDEFVVMLLGLSMEPLEAAKQAQKVGELILLSLNKPYVLREIEHNGTCSVGATLFGKSPQEAAELLKQADIAMYQVKTAGRNDLCFFDPNMLAIITARAAMERDLRHAQVEGQLSLHYQVQVAGNGRPVGAEALIRWQHPERGMVPPGQFIGLAEETGLILPIGEWVLRSACLQLKAWEKVPVAAGLQLAVNVSARQFRAVDFVQQVNGIIQETGIKPELLKLELTESMVLNNVADTIEKMQELKALGVHFSMDDFGTGYSSLSYLTRLPLDQLKIDQSFVRNIGLRASDSAVIDSIIGLARSLGLEVIAEGVETVEQRDFLAEHGCERCQGYLFGKPLTIAEFEENLLSATRNAKFQPAVI